MLRTVGTVFVVTLTLLMTALPGAASQSGNDWQVLVGRETDDHAIQAQAFFPTVITVVAGDTILWNLGGLNSHTVSFLGGQPPPASPIITPDGRSLPNPLLVYVQGGTSYDGSRFANSGVLSSRATSYSLTFTTPGIYPYLCLLHRGMEGTVVVLPTRSRPPKSVAEYRTLGEQEWAALRARGEGLAQSAPTVEEAAPGGATSYFISAGFGGNEASVIRFLPEELSIRVGDTVTWVQSDPQEIHTVTFSAADSPTSLFLADTPPLGPPVVFYDPAATQPQGGPVHRGQGYYNSGILQPFARYTLTFLQPGAYSYICIPHASLGQTGRIVVQETRPNRPADE